MTELGQVGHRTSWLTVFKNVKALIIRNNSICKMYVRYQLIDFFRPPVGYMLHPPNLLLILLSFSFFLWNTLQEIGQFQNRLNQAMQECQYQAQDLMKPGYENDAKMTAKIEDKLIGCMATTVDKYIAMLKPLKDRAVEQMKK
jgi:hypothetical protein